MIPKWIEINAMYSEVVLNTELTGNYSFVILGGVCLYITSILGNAVTSHDDRCYNG